MILGFSAAMACQLHNCKRLLGLQLMYASPSWWGFTSAGDREHMERLIIINKPKRCGFLPMSTPSASTLANKADQRLFRSVTHNPYHVLHTLLPDVRRVSNNLRP